MFVLFVILTNEHRRTQTVRVRVQSQLRRIIDPQEILTKDSVTVHVGALVYHQVHDPLNAAI